MVAQWLKSEKWSAGIAVPATAELGYDGWNWGRVDHPAYAEDTGFGAAGAGLWLPAVGVHEMPLSAYRTPQSLGMPTAHCGHHHGVVQRNAAAAVRGSDPADDARLVPRHRLRLVVAGVGRVTNVASAARARLARS